MKNKGYTLLELLGVIVILSVLVTLVFPSVINFIKKSNDTKDSITNDLIMSAAEDYINDNSSELYLTIGDEHCVSIDTLIGKKYLDESLIEEDLYTSKSIKVTYTDKYNYELVDSASCKPAEIVKFLRNYSPVEYIESTGTQYIDTGYVVQEDDELELTYKLTENTKSGDKILMGSSQISTGGQLWVDNATNNKWYIRFGSTSSESLDFDSSQYEGTLTIRKNEFIVNGKKILSPSFNSMPTTTLYLFGGRLSDNIVRGAYAQIRNFKITRNSEIIRHFIPCYRKSDGVIGMYDLVEGKFYTNAGTGEFLKGEEVEI